MTLNPEIAIRAAAYGIPGIAVDGNDVVAVWQAAQAAVRRGARAATGPTLIEAKTYRTVGHHEGDPVTGIYRTQDEVDAWAKRCPVATFQTRMIEDYAIVTGRELDEIEPRSTRPSRRRSTTRAARRSPIPRPTRFTSSPIRINPPEALARRRPRTGRASRRAGSTRCATASPRRCGATRTSIYFGEGTGERGGTFAHTKNLYQEFGADRMVDTPISELGFTGAALGASATGVRCIADLMFADFLFEAAGQIVAAGREAALHVERPDAARRW